MSQAAPPAKPQPGVGSRPVVGRPSPYRDILGAHPKMRRIFRLVSRVAPTDSTILIAGESGTGKELIARAIHLQSRRASGPFVPVNCGALPENLIESELFGYVRGAFTGAQAGRPGLVEEGDGGTLFLDEIGEMPLSTQVKLLRTLENGEVRRLGENETRLVDVRVVAATNKDLLAETRAGRFREDLFYRLNVVTIELPPLRDRREDIGLLATYFLDRVSRKLGRAGLRFTPQAMALLERYDYPGNVRELENAVERAATLSEGNLIGPAELPADFRTPRMLPQAAQLATEGRRPPATSPASVLGSTLDSAAVLDPGAERDGWSLADVEREHIERVLVRHRGNVTNASKQLGISRTTLWRKMRLYGIRRPR